MVTCRNCPSTVLKFLNHPFFVEKQIIKLTYDEKVQLTAYWKQISSGPYDPEKYPDVGYFDVIGNDRR